MGLPATLLPLELKSASIALLDQDAAEAVLEHRAVLGGVEGSLGLIQAGSPSSENLVNVMVVDGAAAAVETRSRMAVPDQALRFAEQAAGALNAALVAIVIELRSGIPVVWDARPVPDYRDAIPVGNLTVAQAIAHTVERRLATGVQRLSVEREPAWRGIGTLAQGQGLGRDLIVSA
jgi:hypothetical protein